MPRVMREVLYRERLLMAHRLPAWDVTTYVDLLTAAPKSITDVILMHDAMHLHPEPWR